MGTAEAGVEAGTATLPGPVEAGGAAGDRERLRQVREREAAELRRMAAQTGGCLAALIIGAAVDRFATGGHAVAVGFYIVALLAGGWDSTREALRELRAGSLNVDLLMVAAALGAAAVGEWPEGAILLFLFSLSRALEAYILGRTRRAVEALMELSPDEAVLIEDGVERRVAAAGLKAGDRIVVRPGERIAADGEVAAGSTSVDQSAMTGESLPVDKAIGDPVFAGTLNQRGAIEVRVTHPAGETTLAKIVHLVTEAQATKARSQVFTDWFGQRYTFFVMALAALTFAIPWALGYAGFERAFYRSMTVLVVASPCAVVISIPAALLSAIAGAARGGVLFKGGAELERAAELRAIAFDKTGTLTVGRPQLVGLHAAPGLDEAEVLRLAASAEALSEHPLSRAVVEAAESRGLVLDVAEEMEALVGRGIAARVGGRRLLVGKAELFDGRPIAPELLDAAARRGAAGETTFFVGDENDVLGLVAVADTLRPTAEAAIGQLRAMGFERLVMLTGDNPAVARAIGGRLGLEAEAGLLPEGKLEALNRLRAEFAAVAMVGDGINDAPSLAAADLGVSLGGNGTDVALETADLVLMTDDLRDLPRALRLARRARSVIRQNLVFALGVMLVLLCVTLFRSLRLPLAVVGHEGSTVLVILNGFRLFAFGGKD